MIATLIRWLKTARLHGYRANMGGTNQRLSEPRGAAVLIGQLRVDRHQKPIQERAERSANETPECLWEVTRERPSIMEGLRGWRPAEGRRSDTAAV